MSNSSYVNGVINISYTYATEENHIEVVKKERTLSNLINIPVVNDVSGMIITKQAPSIAEFNEVFTYTINVANQSGALQSNLSVTDNMPDKFNVLTNMIVVEKGDLVLQSGIDYIANIDNGILTISGVNAGELGLNVGEELTIEVPGYVSL